MKKILTAGICLVATLGIAGAAAAECAAYAKPAQTAEAPVIVEGGSTGS